MNLRPAGMSDDEEEEEIYFGVNDPKTHDDTNKDHTDEASLPKKIINYHNYHNEEQALESQVINACIHGQMDTIYEYLKKNDVDKLLRTGWSLLLHSASYVQFDIMVYLLSHGANPNIYGGEFTPLLALCASRCGLPETCLKCLVLLIEAKADVNAVGKHRETALMHACKTKNTEFVMELLKHIDDINFCDNYRQTALNHAVTSNRPDIVSVLLMHDADPDMPDKDGYTPEMIAVREGFKEICELLDVECEKEDYEIFQIEYWGDLFPELYPRKEKSVHEEILNLLFNMGPCNMERYKILFARMELKTFVQLTEDDLCHLGVNITVHRERFLEYLHYFHCQMWKVKTLEAGRKSTTYSIFISVGSLGIIKTQIGIIASSFTFVKNSFMECATKDIYLNSMERVKYEEELIKIRKALEILKTDMKHFKKLAQKLHKENDIGIPACFLSSPKKRKNRTKWVISLSVTLIIGLYICKTCIHK
ncbi:uncharacterized protein LOC105186446 [Harpegnathos saltator]|uniref:uncharacterized protein LOC105186446 n=1 Tax=Harpegnathos saltator TaxID=610380 RepID=UPI0005912BCF|nr:uncharacterized protein LOC105186446 [Harpegnathos saltator]